MADDKDYTAVPPPELLSAPKQPLDFNDALSKARAIAEKLKQQRPAAAPPSAPSAGTLHPPTTSFTPTTTTATHCGLCIRFEAWLLR